MPDDEDALAEQFEQERTDLAAKIQKAMTSSYIGPPRPMLLGDADRAVVAVVSAGWVPPTEVDRLRGEFAEYRRVAQQLFDSLGYATTDTLIDRTPTERLEQEEQRLTGQPPSFPPYDFTARTPEHIEAIQQLHAKAEERGWTNVQLHRRQLTVEQWTETHRFTRRRVVVQDPWKDTA